ncbi:MAG: NADH-quinone oxidoreductase subunit C [Chloroflexaceae bacterium]|nr:NADH-quinone oxidoreductase subunit C [Chloroflexaceae bacterium]
MAIDNQTVLQRVSSAFPDAVLSSSTFRDDLTVQIAADHLVAVTQFLRDDAELRYVLLENLCGVDYLGREPRFEVVYHLFSLAQVHRLCLKVGVPEEHPHVPSVVEVWPTANWQEREAYDMFGIIFDGHPSLERILMPDDWEGHPQRKDVPLGGEEVAFTFNAEQIYAHKVFAKE